MKGNGAAMRVMGDIISRTITEAGFPFLSIIWNRSLIIGFYVSQNYFKDAIQLLLTT